MGSIDLRHATRSIVYATFFLLGLFCIFSGREAFAQLDQGAINGVVKDATGALIPHAQVSLRNTDTNFVSRSTTDAKGQYSFSPIKIGRYMLSATAPGFETTNQENVVVNIQDRLNIDITLKPGAVKETVTVTGAPPMLQQESASVGQVMDTETINNTPLNGRNWVYIAQLSAGVDPGLSAGGARGGGTGDFSANGQRTTQNNFILDGVDNNVNVDDFQNGASYNVKPPPDALAEFKIDTSNYSAEFGHSAGAVLSASIKSGTNQFHGDAWEYVRNTRLDAADWDSAGGAVPAYHENQFGATLGGPIWKNHLFYFGDAEMNRIAFATPLLLSVPTASQRKGDLSEYFLTAKTGKSAPIGVFEPNSGGQVALTGTAGAVANPDPNCLTYSTTCAWSPATPGSGIGAATTNNYGGTGNQAVSGNFYNGLGMASPIADSVGLAVLQDYPLPNTGGWTGKASDAPGSGLLYNNYSLNDPIHDNTWQWDQRLDWDLSAKDQAYARFSYTHDQIAAKPPLGPVLDGGYYLPSNGVSAALTLNMAQNFMMSETHIFNPNLINEFRFGYNWGHFVIGQENANTPASSLIPGLGGVPFSGFAGPNGGTPFIILGGARRLSYAGSPTDTPSVERQNVYQILDNITKVHGSHSFKLGFELQAIRTSFAQSQYPRGRYNFNGQYDEKADASGTPVSLTNLGIADMLTDNMGNIGLSPGWNTAYYRNYRAAYFQDDWRVNSKLTANLGLRYDFIQPASNKGGDLANLVISSENETALGAGTSGLSATGVAQWVMPAKVAAAAPLSANFLSLLTNDHIALNYTTANQNSLVSVQHYNFAPRIGLAYQYDTKTVVRAAYGLFYGAIEAPGGAELETNYPFSYQVVMDNQYVVQYGGCYPSTQTGAFNINSQCPSNGTSDVDIASGTPIPGGNPGANQPNGFAPFPYPTSLEAGGSLYFANGGLANFASASAIAMSQTNIKTPYTQSFNLTVERELMPNLVASIAYVGNNSRHTFAGTQPLAPLAITSNNNPSKQQGSTAFPGISTENAMESWVGASLYNSLQGKIEKRYSNGASFLASYTWSHAEDNAENPGIGGGPGYRNTNLIPLKDEMTNSNYDVRHRFTFNGNYDLPFGEGRKYMHQGGALDYLVGGWSASATWQAQTGIPFTVGTGGNAFQSASGLSQVNAIRVGDPFKGGGTAPAANIDMQGVTCPTSVHNRTNWYNPCAFVDPKPGSSIAPGVLLTDEASAIAYGGGKANQIHGPGYQRVNMSAFKNFKTLREQYVQFRADAFNLFNTPSLGQPGDTNLDSTAGQITNPQGFQNYTPDARFFQLAAKYVF